MYNVLLFDVMEIEKKGTVEPVCEEMCRLWL